MRLATTLLILRESDEHWSKPLQGGFDELDGVVSLRRRGGRRRDTRGIGHAPDGAQEAEVRGLGDPSDSGLREGDSRFPDPELSCGL